jgi:hypothetical protein
MNKYILSLSLLTATFCANAMDSGNSSSSASLQTSPQSFAGAMPPLALSDAMVQEILQEMQKPEFYAEYLAKHKQLNPTVPPKSEAELKASGAFTISVMSHLPKIMAICQDPSGSYKEYCEAFERVFADFKKQHPEFPYDSLEQYCNAWGQELASSGIELPGFPPSESDFLNARKFLRAEVSRGKQGVK